MFDHYAMTGAVIAPLATVSIADIAMYGAQKILPNAWSALASAHTICSRTDFKFDDGFLESMRSRRLDRIVVYISTGPDDLENVSYLMKQLPSAEDRAKFAEALAALATSNQTGPNVKLLAEAWKDVARQRNVYVDVDECDGPMEAMCRIKGHPDNVTFVM